MKNLVAIIAGDPDSINTEIIGKMWKKRSSLKRINFFVIGNYNLIKIQLKNLKIKVNLKKINSIKEQNFKKNLLVYDISFQGKKAYIKNSINLGVELAKAKKILGFVNCPINKRDIFGDKNSGITEFIAKKFSLIGREAMLIYNNKLSVSPMTTHVSLKNVSKNITKNKIVRKIESINNFYKNKLKFYPKIGVIGLNPHNDELRRNSEEKKIIIPAIKFLKKKKVRVEGPISGDTAFLNYKKKGYNVLVGMYHDQVLAPFKALFGFNAINITVGIPILRISPDHGTGKDIKNKNKADPTSLIEAVKFFTNKNVKT